MGPRGRVIPPSSEWVLALLSVLSLYGSVTHNVADGPGTISQLMPNHTLIRPFLPPKLRQGVILGMVIGWQKKES